MKYLAAAVQYNCRLLDKPYNLQKLEEWTRKAAEHGAKLIVLPEMGTSGYYFSSREEVEEIAETIPRGETVQRFKALAKELDCYIVVCLPEKDGRRLYNSCVLIGPEGVFGKYRKIHPYTPDTLWAKNGDLPIEVYDTPIGRISMLICMDVSYPASVRVAAAKGAQVICVPCNWCEPTIPSSIWMTRAYENQVAMVVNNRHGVEKGFVFSGGAAVIDQSGKILAAQMEGDGIALAEIDTEKRAAEGCLADRRPALYTGLQTMQYLWPDNQLHVTFGTPRMPEGGILHAGVAQFAPRKGDHAYNLKKIEELAALAKEKGINVLTFPELALCGRPKTREEASAWAESPGSPNLSRLAELASGLSMSLICGFVLLEDGELYNAAGLTAPDGTTVLYRKSHLLEEEKTWALAGDDPGAWIDIGGSRIGILIGAEIWVTELPTLLANDGCDLITVPADLEKCCESFPLSADPETHWHIARVRGNENNTYIAFSNAKGYSGVFNCDMFEFPRKQEVIVSGMEEAVAGVRYETYPMICRDGQWMPNPVRTKLMLATRQPYWYDSLFEMDEEGGKR